MRFRAVGMLLLSIGLAGIAAAQTVAPLPKVLTGRWTAVVPGVRTFTDRLSIVFEGTGEPGPVTGRLTSYGVTCGAQDEPISGTWDGTELRLESTVRTNVNAQRMNADCSNGRVSYVLTRKPGQAAFEGEARREGTTNTVQVVIAP